MQSAIYISAFLAPAFVAAMPWAGPQPTAVVEADPIQGWSPAPTGAARIEDSLFELFRRQDANDQTCGWINGNPASSITCPTGSICATNTYYGVAGCCDPASLSSCTLYTRCVPSSLMTSCTASNCLSNNQIVRCTDSASPYCYNWYFNFVTTTMTQYGCAATPLTVSVARTTSAVIYVTVSDSSSSTSSSSSSTTSPPAAATSSDTDDDDHDKGSSTPIGPIVGGVVGGVGAIAIIAGLVAWFCLRKRKNKKTAGAATTAAGTTETKPPGTDPNYQPVPQQQPYDPNYPQQYQQNQYQQQPGNTNSYYGAGAPGQDQKHLYPAGVSEMAGSPPTSPAPQYSGPHSPQQQQVAQIDGTMIQPPPRDPQGNAIHEAPA